MVNKPKSSQVTMPHPSRTAGDSAEHNRQKDMSSTDRSEDNHYSHEKRAASVSRGSVLSLEDQSNDT